MKEMCGAATKQRESSSKPRQLDDAILGARASGRADKSWGARLRTCALALLSEAARVLIALLAGVNPSFTPVRLVFGAHTPAQAVEAFGAHVAVLLRLLERAGHHADDDDILQNGSFR